MHIYTKIYEFSASAGAFEGYVYPKEKLNPDDITDWIDNLVTGYHHLPVEVREHFQSALDGTLGRAVRALTPILGKDHETIRKLKSMVVGALPKTVNDFQKKKWFEES